MTEREFFKRVELLGGRCGFQDGVEIQFPGEAPRQIHYLYIETEAGEPPRRTPFPLPHQQGKEMQPTVLRSRCVQLRLDPADFTD